MVTQGVGAGLSIALSEKPQETQMLAMAAFGVGSQLGYMLPFSRTHEYEADEMGLYFMAMAGYDPGESVGFWQTMARNGGSKPPELLSTHPLDQNRIAKIEAKLPEAMKYYRGQRGK